MTASLRQGLFALVLMVLAALAAPGGAAAQPSQADTGTDRQILVLLRLAPEHYRGGSDYGGGYGDDLSRSARQRLADQIARRHGLSIVTDWPMPMLGLDCFVMAAPPGRSSDEAAAQLASDPSVAMAEPMHHYRAQGAANEPNDPLFEAQPAAHEWRLADLHKLATGKGVTVAVIDSRVDLSQPDLIGQVVVSEDFVKSRGSAPELHGTGVAGVIAAKADNGVGIVGVAPGAKLMALRACWQEQGPDAASPPTVCDSLSLAKAIYFAVEHHAQVINLSLGGPQDVLLAKLLDLARARGAVVVAAFDRNLPGGGFPASHPGVVAVADESVAALPSRVYTAPGRDVPTTQPGGRWRLVNGSSYAAAHVSGLFALLRERRAGQIQLVSNRADGGGSIDACASLSGGAESCTYAVAREYPATVRR